MNLKENSVKLLERRKTGKRWMDKKDLASRGRSLNSRSYCFLQVFVIQERVTVKRTDRMVNLLMDLLVPFFPSSLKKPHTQEFPGYLL